MWDDIALEVAIIERLAHEKVRQKIASQQLGEAWIGLERIAPGEQPHDPSMGQTSALTFLRD